MAITPTARGTAPVVLLGAVLNALAALVFGGLHLLHEVPPLLAVLWPGAVALAAVYALPAALAAVALRGRRPAALLGAGLLGLPLAFTAMSGVSLVLVVPVVFYLVGYAAWTPRPRLGAGAVAWTAITVAAGVAAFVLLFASPGGRPTGYCYSWTEDLAGRRSFSQARPDASIDPGRRSGSGSLSVAPGVGAAGAGCISDVVTPTEAALGLGAAVIALAASLRLPQAAPTRPG
jgi:hypothetical protein